MAWFRCSAPAQGGSLDQIATIALGQEFDYFELETETETIPQYLFHGSMIRDVESVDVLTVQERAFEGCTNLRKINLPNCTRIGSYAFACNRTTYANSIQINLPAVQNIGTSAFASFYGVDSSAELSFPACTYVGQYAFQGTLNNPFTCKSIEFPQVTNMGGSSFTRLIADTVDIGATCSSMGATPFGNATINKLIVRATTPPTLATNNGLGSGANITQIYVPDSAVNTYKDSTNYPRWAAYGAIISPLSDLPST